MQKLNNGSTLYLLKLLQNDQAFGHTAATEQFYPDDGAISLYDRKLGLFITTFIKDK